MESGDDKPVPSDSQPLSNVASAIDVVSRIQRVESSLSPAERRVAETVRQDFEAATRMTIAELARRAGVSQPTVTRFSRSVGSRSFGEFKIQLATTLTVAAAYLKSDRIFDDDAGQLARAIMINAANAIREGLDQLDTTALSTAIDALASGRRIEIYGQGSASAAIAEDAKLRLFRLGTPVAAYSDGHQQRISAATLGPGDVAFAISNSGRTKPVIEAVEIAHSFGATTIALTRPDTALAEAADILIAVAVPEVDDILRPTPSRFAHMAIVDTLATGVAARLGERARESLRRVRYTLARLGVAIPAPTNDPTPLMKDLEPRE